MATIFFNADTFKANFPAFKNVPASALELTWSAATNYMTDQTSLCFAGSWPPKKQEYALQLMTAHLQFLNAQVNAGQGVGLMQSATIDKVTVQLTPPPVPNQFRFWLNQSPYGQSLLSLLETAVVGGFLAGGWPVAGTLRR